MATIINTPGNTDSGGSSMGMFLGIILVLVVVALFFIYGLPLFRQSGSTQTNSPQINVPGGSEGGAQINVPDKIDINLNGTK